MSANERNLDAKNRMKRFCEQIDRDTKQLFITNMWYLYVICKEPLVIWDPAEHYNLSGDGI